jgi:transcriptional regulator with XRE-family HTH domain
MEHGLDEIKRLGRNLQIIRDERGISVKKMAELAGVSTGQVYGVEGQKKEERHVPNFLVFLKIAAVLKIGIDDLLYRDVEAERLNPQTENIDAKIFRSMEMIRARYVQLEVKDKEAFYAILKAAENYLSQELLKIPG